MDVPSPQKLIRLVEQNRAILTEGSVVERLRRFGPVPLDPLLIHAPLVYCEDGRSALADLHRQYLAIGQRFDLPLLTFTDTWRANAERVKAAGFSGRDINGDCARFLRGLIAETGAYAARVCVGGLIGCRGDAYKPQDALPERQAQAFHMPQIEALAAAGVDVLFAATLPALSEAEGIARAMATTGVPYVISFVLNRSGRLLDDTRFEDAVAALDARVSTPPLFFMANCCHAAHLRAAFSSANGHAAELLRRRVIGLQANTSAKDASELDNLPVLDSELPERFASDLLALRRDFGLRILGGCCGSDERHIAEVARHLASTHRVDGGD